LSLRCRVRRPIPSSSAVIGSSGLRAFASSLRGRVLPIGGLKEKILAAHRGGIRHVMIPSENEKDLKEIPAQIKRNVKIVMVDHMDEVLGSALALEDAQTFLQAYNLEIVLAPDKEKELLIEREGELITVELNTGSDPKFGMGAPGWALSIGGDQPAVIRKPVKGEPAFEAGLKAGDRILGADGIEPIGELELRLLIMASPERQIALKVGRGEDILEIGVPFSDPLADGPIIQAAYTRSLARGTTVHAVEIWTDEGFAPDPSHGIEGPARIRFLAALPKDMRYARFRYALEVFGRVELAKALEQVAIIGRRSFWEPRTVLVTGAGPIGLLAALFARLIGLDVQ